MSLHTVNSEIQGSYIGAIVTLSTVNGKISGNLSTSNKATVSSCNGSIELKIKCIDGLLQSRSTTPDLLESASTTSDIKFSSSLPSNPTTIEVKASTANSKISINYEEVSSNIILISQVSTSNAPISVKHIGFVGDFEVSRIFPIDSFLLSDKTLITSVTSPAINFKLFQYSHSTSNSSNLLFFAN